VTERRQYEQGLVEAREWAEELAQLKSAFLANMSHEVRTPLAGIIGFAEVLEDELEGAQREAAALVRESGMRLLETLNSVLDLARLESDATELKLVPLDVRAEIEAVARLFGPTAERKGLTFDVRLPEGGAPLRAMLDSAALHRVLANLVSNAIKFTDRGRITLEADRVNGHLALHVRDTGCGMSASFLPHVFEEFRQESSGLTRAHQGSGLGLAITKRLVDMLHGTITVESTVGLGTTFTVRFPELKK
ncbi:MAG TPA: HAMP domain-containing sensor histidine kinase, partial [Rhodothermales bacterium]|nr:HAMP domain-containing sensor histidine kinase [Rhodothermales bacterium]